MSTTSVATLLHVGASGNADGMIDAISAAGVHVVEAPATTEALREWLKSGKAEELNAALIHAGAAALQLARVVHEARPEAQIIFLTDAENEPRLRRELLVAPRIGRHWSVIESTDANAADSIRQVITGAQRRRTLRTTINRINVRLADAAEQPARSRVVTDHFVATVFGQITDGLVLLDDGLRVVTSNNAARRMFGEELRPGAELAPLLGESTAGLLERICNVDMTTVQVTLPREQTWTPLEIRFTRVFDDVRRPLGTAVVARDVTEQKRREARADLLTQILAALSSTLNIDTAMQRLADLVVRWFADVCVIDLVDGDSLTRVAVAAAHPDDIDAAEGLRRFSPGRKPRHPAQDALRDPVARFENELTVDDLRRLTASEEHLDVARGLGVHAFLAVPLLTPQRAVGAMTLLRGRSQQHYSADDAQLLQEIAQFTATAIQNAWLYETAEAANRSKDEFLATLSHELRTPMTSVLGWIQIMRLGGLQPEELEEAISSIETSARAQAQLIDDLLDLSRVQMGKLQLQVDEIDFVSVLSAAVDTVRPAASAKGLTLETHFGKLPRVAADPNRLQQVFWNLLNNAIKFTDRGGRIIVSADLHDGQVRVRVGDTGRGISAEFLPVIFERFRQADSATTRRYGGLGLGLAIVKQIVEMHGGTVAVESPGPGHGSTFTVLLPVETRGTQVDEGATPEPVADAVPLRDVGILIVESDAGSTLSVSTALTAAGATVRTFSSVRAALGGLRDAAPQVLISATPAADDTALNLIREVRTTLRLSPERLPAIALTDRGDLQTRVSLLGAGFQRHLGRPFAAQQLVAVIAQLLAR